MSERDNTLSIESLYLLPSVIAGLTRNPLNQLENQGGLWLGAAMTRFLEILNCLIKLIGKDNAIFGTIPNI
jgi:hypothetical protein